jgi:hypothetical protein
MKTFIFSFSVAGMLMMAACSSKTGTTTTDSAVTRLSDTTKADETKKAVDTVKSTADSVKKMGGHH